MQAAAPRARKTVADKKVAETAARPASAGAHVETEGEFAAARQDYLASELRAGLPTVFVDRSPRGIEVDGTEAVISETERFASLGAGIKVGVGMAPILPGISDSREQIRAVVEACIETLAPHVSSMTDVTLEGAEMAGQVLPMLLLSHTARVVAEDSPEPPGPNTATTGRPPFSFWTRSSIVSNWAASASSTASLVRIV